MTYTSNLGEDIFLTSCVNQFLLPKLYFLVGSYWYQADPADYVYVLDEKCFVCLKRGDNNWIFGVSLMRNYYVVHDVDAQNFGMTPIQSSTPSTRKDPVELGSLPTQVASPNRQNNIKIAAYSVASGLVSALIYRYVLSFQPLDLPETPI